MQKWEYLTFSGNSHYINGVEHRTQRGELAYMIANRIGQDGWELVAVDGSSYYFKRPTI